MNLSRRSIGTFLCIFAASLVASMTAAQLGGYGDPAEAFNASSTDFYVRQNILFVSGGTSASPYSTSTDFISYGAGGQAAIGTSTSTDFGLQGGFLRNIVKGPAPTYEVVHYHWRNDDGSETGATSATGGAQDTPLSAIATGAIKRIRFNIANHGGTVLGYAAQQFKIEFGVLSTSCAAISTWTTLGSGVAWNIASSANLTDGANTTNIAISSGGTTNSNHTFIAVNGGVKDAGDTTAAIYVPSDSFLDLEYAVTPTSFASNGTTYCFRVDNAGSTMNYKYTVYPQATVSATSLTFTLDSAAQTFPALTPGTAVSTSSILSVYTNNSTGFNASLFRNNSLATLLLTGSSTISIPDKTAWAPGATCATAGNATASTTSPLTLSFRVQQTGTDASNFCSAWWGSNDTSLALFAGLPSTAQQIVNRSTASSPTTTTQVLYSLNVPGTQQTGSYTGTVTYTVTANP